MPVNTGYVGIDPGAKGAICYLNPGNKVIQFIETAAPHNERIDFISQFDDITIIMLEDVHSIFGASAKSNFSFGKEIGIIQEFIAHTSIGMDLVAPRKWQKEVGIVIPAKLKGAVRSKAIKRLVVDKAIQLYPSARAEYFGPKGGLKDGHSDATLIAHYARLKYGK